MGEAEEGIEGVGGEEEEEEEGKGEEKDQNQRKESKDGKLWHLPPCRTSTTNHTEQCATRRDTSI